MMKRGVLLFAVLLLLLPLGAQEPQQQDQQDQSQPTQKQKQKQKSQQQQDQQQQPSDDQSKPKPLFGGQVSAKSSKRGKDTTSLGFNGLDPQGKVEQAALNSSPTSADQAKVDKIAAEKVDSAELKQFMEQGNLKTVKKGGGQ